MTLDPHTGNEYNKNYKMTAEDQMDRQIVLRLRGFEHVACGRMRSNQLRVVHMIAKKRCERPYIETEGRIDREMGRRTDT